MDFSNVKSKQKIEKFLNPSAVSNPICDRGDKLMLKNEYKQAVVEYLSAIMHSGSDVRPYMSVSKAYKKLKEYPKAIKKLEHAKKISSFDADIYYELGINHLLNEDSNLARKNFINSIRLNKKNVHAQIQLALSHELLEESEMALAIYQKIIEENPRLVLAYAHKASLCVSLKMYEEAIVIFSEILKINPSYYRANLGIGICLDKLRRFSSAVRFYKKYIVKKPKSPTTRALVGRICEMYAKGELKRGFSSNLKVV